GLGQRPAPFTLVVAADGGGVDIVRLFVGDGEDDILAGYGYAERAGDLQRAGLARERQLRVALPLRRSADRQPPGGPGDGVLHIVLDAPLGVFDALVDAIADADARDDAGQRAAGGRADRAGDAGGGQARDRRSRGAARERQGGQSQHDRPPHTRLRLASVRATPDATRGCGLQSQGAPGHLAIASSTVKGGGRTIPAPKRLIS